MPAAHAQGGRTRRRRPRWRGRRREEGEEDEEGQELLGRLDGRESTGELYQATYPAWFNDVVGARGGNGGVGY